MRFLVGVVSFVSFCGYSADLFGPISVVDALSKMQAPEKNSGIDNPNADLFHNAQVSPVVPDTIDTLTSNAVQSPLELNTTEEMSSNQPSIISNITLPDPLDPLEEEAAKADLQLAESKVIETPEVEDAQSILDNAFLMPNTQGSKTVRDAQVIDQL